MLAIKQSLRVSILATLLVASLGAADQLVFDPETSACMEKLNEYLSVFGITSNKLEGNQLEKIKAYEQLTDQVVMALDQAKHHLEQPLGSGESLGSVFRPLNPSNRCPRRRLSATFAGIRDAFDNCGQESLDLLMIVANYKLTSGDKALISELTRNRLELCWQRFVSSVSRQLDRAMGKMRKPVFKNLERIAETMIETRRGPTRSASSHGTGSIHIDEQKARDRARAEAGLEVGVGAPTSLDLMESKPETFLDILETFRGIDFGREEKVREFSRAIHKIFKEQQAKATPDKREHRRLLRNFLTSFFDEPCRDLIDRVRSIVNFGKIYRSHIEQTLGQALAEEKQSNARLDYELEVYRVCRFGTTKTDKVVELMEKF